MVCDTALFCHYTDNPADAREEMLPPPLPPHPSGYHQQLQVGGGGGYGEEDDDQVLVKYNTQHLVSHTF